jgi:hypothetical protein
LRRKPDFAEAIANLGVALAEQGRLDEAVDCYREALARRPTYAEASNNLGNTLIRLGRHAEAGPHYDDAVRHRPGWPAAHYNRAIAWLQLGDFARGWPEYEWRLKALKSAPPPPGIPAWDGTPLDGRTILLDGEQGFGDMIHFTRYAPLVRARGGRVLVRCPWMLASLLATCPGVDDVVLAGPTLPPIDVFAPMMSLPRLLGTTLETIPAAIPYLRAEPRRAGAWREELGRTPSFKVGIAWQGDPAHLLDRHRSFPLSAFAAIAALPGVTLYSLQKFFGSEQLPALGDRFPVIDLSSRLGDFMDTAAVMCNLDLVIAPDTAVAHLAGALGVTVWAGLSQRSEWRWLLERDDSPWYPTMRLFRQHVLDDWDTVFQRMRDELRLLAPYTKTRQS